MGCALALPLVASLATAASADVTLDLRAESRTSTVAPESIAPYTREALLARPGAALVIDAVPLRVGGRYAATIWTSDVEAMPSPLVTHDVQVRAEARHASPWRARVLAAAARGWTDPFADPVQALSQTEPAQAPALEPIEYEAVRAGADGSVPLGPRTIIGVEASAWRSGAVKSEDRASYPVQDRALARLAVEHLLTPRNTLRLAADASPARTERETGTDRSAWATASARSRVRMTRLLDAWAGAGVLLSFRDEPDAPPRRAARLTGEVGLAYAAGRLEAEVSAQTIPFTDRFTGDVVAMFQGAGALRWRASPSLAMAATASGGVTQSGDTLAALDARGTHALGERVSLAAGIVGRWQHERLRPEASFAEIGLIVALSWTSGPPRP